LTSPVYLADANPSKADTPANHLAREEE